MGQSPLVRNVLTKLKVVLAKIRRRCQGRQGPWEHIEGKESPGERRGKGGGAPAQGPPAPDPPAPGARGPALRRHGPPSERGKPARRGAWGREQGVARL